MTDDQKPPVLLDGSGRPARKAIEVVRCPRCQVQCPPGDTTRRVRSGGFGADVHDVCVACGYDWIGELTV